MVAHSFMLPSRERVERIADCSFTFLPFHPIPSKIKHTRPQTNPFVTQNVIFEICKQSTNLRTPEKVMFVYNKFFFSTMA